MRVFAALPLMTLGIATLIALRQAYGVRRTVGDDLFVTCISIAGWLLVLLGISCLVTPFLMPIVLIIIAMCVAKYREGERRTLLWMLSLAEQRGLSLSDSARAFAAWRSDEMARRAWLLADHLEAGMSLPDALRASGNPLPADATLMVRLRESTRQAQPYTSERQEQERQDASPMPSPSVLTSASAGEQGSTAATVPASLQPLASTALRTAAQNRESTDDAWRPIFERILYLLLVLQVCIVVTGFFMLKILPSIHQIFEDFSMELPAATQLMFVVMRWGPAAWVPFSPIVAYMTGVIFVSLFFYAQGQIWVPWPLGQLFGLSETASVLRGLAVCLEQGLPVPAALQHMANAYPKWKTAQRLQVAAQVAARGGDWCDSLCYENVISRSQLAVLRSAIQARNLAWALRELAQLSDQQVTYRAKTALNIVTPICFLLLGAFVAVIAFGCMLPLISIIQNFT